MKEVRKMEMKTDKVVDEIIRIVEEEGLENIELTKQEAGACTQSKQTVYEVLAMICAYGQITRGFILRVEPMTPDNITVVHGYQIREPGRYIIEETLFSDGSIKYISRRTDDNGKHHDEYCRYKLISASFVLIIRYYENSDTKQMTVYLYGYPSQFTKKLANVLRKLNKILSS
jgi:hypothetical protein